MIAYLILVHRYPHQFKRLFKSIYDPENFYLIHVDKRSDIKLHEEVASFLEDYSNTDILTSEDTIWGGYSLVDAELRGIKQLLDMGVKWDFFINLSGQDFPLKTQAEIKKFLSKNMETDFLKVSDQKIIRPETLSRIENFVSEVNKKIKCLPVIKRPYMTNITPYIGNQWMILSRKFCEFLTFNPEVDKFKDFYKNTFIADEGFFQTVIMNTSYSSTIVSDDQRTIDWVQLIGEIKLRPRDFLAKDAVFLLSSKGLFARKFNETVDSEILDILEDKLSAKVKTKIDNYQILKMGLINPIATKAERKLNMEKNMMINPELLKNIVD